MNRDDYPRCKTCRHWDHNFAEDEGYCLLVEAMRYNGHLARIVGTDDIPVDLMTRPDFGCIHHAPKPGA